MGIYANTRRFWDFTLINNGKKCHDFMDQINKKIIGVIALILSDISLNAPAAVSFKVLHDFAGAEGAAPTGQLAQGRDGWLYGTAFNGFCSTNCDGAAFKIKPDGTAFTLIHKFLCNSNEGCIPVGGLSLGRDGNFYGVTSSCAKQPDGGCSGRAGAIYKMTPAGAVYTLIYV